jgi:AraC-like DNA-binding protein
MTVGYRELIGELKPASGRHAPLPGATVVYSRISHGGAAGALARGLTVRYVGRGAECYSIAGRYCRLGEDQLMIAPQQLASEVEVRRGEEAGTLGLCVFIPQLDDGAELLVDGPIILPAICALGSLFRRSLKRLNGPVRSLDEPNRIALETVSRLTETIHALDGQVDLVPGVKRRTRFEAVRRLNLARAYLHSVTDRGVPLDELAREVAVSSFQLLRGFRDCFGETPAAYHRRLRLNLAREMAERDGLPYAFVADRFGFAGGASFSHAYRRTFGVPPVRAIARG